MVRIGNYDANSMAFNSCKFDLLINNGYQDQNSNGITARGIILTRVLQSNINLVATCARGYAAVLDTCEFNTISGSFSNAQVNGSGNSIYKDGYGLWLNNLVSNSFITLNLEVCYNGINFVGNTYGNVFTSVISNNMDKNGYVFNVLAQNDNTKNRIVFAVVRTAIQQDGTYPTLYCKNVSKPFLDVDDIGGY